MNPFQKKLVQIRLQIPSVLSECIKTSILKQIQTDIATLQENYAEIEAILQQTQKELTATKKELLATQKSKNKLKAAAEETDNKAQELAKTVSFLETQRETHHKNITNIRDENDWLRSQYDALGKKKAVYERTITRREIILKRALKLRKENKRLKSENSRLKSQFEIQADTLQDNQATIIKLQVENRKLEASEKALRDSSQTTCVRSNETNDNQAPYDNLSMDFKRPQLEENRQDDTKELFQIIQEQRTYIDQLNRRIESSAEEHHQKHKESESLPQKERKIFQKEIDVLTKEILFYQKLTCKYEQRLEKQLVQIERQKAAHTSSQKLFQKVEKQKEELTIYQTQLKNAHSKNKYLRKSIDILRQQSAANHPPISGCQTDTQKLEQATPTRLALAYTTLLENYKSISADNYELVNCCEYLQHKIKRITRGGYDEYDLTPYAAFQDWLECGVLENSDFEMRHISRILQRY